MTKMLKSLIESKLPSNFVIIQDTEKVRGEDLFVTFLSNHSENGGVKKIILLCCENSPEFYLPKCKQLGKIITKNYFKDPVGWNVKSESKPDFSILYKNTQNVSDAVIFIDSITALMYYHGFCSAYKILKELKLIANKVICLVHGDLCAFHNLEELQFISSTYIKLLKSEFDNILLENKYVNGKVVELIHKKPGGKVINQREIIEINQESKINYNHILNDEEILRVTTNAKDYLNNLTTFKLGFSMSDSEKKAKEELVLPYIRSKEPVLSGEIIYKLDEDDFEDDPDDDLDI